MMAIVIANYPHLGYAPKMAVLHQTIKPSNSPANSKLNLWVNLYGEKNVTGP